MAADIDAGTTFSYELRAGDYSSEKQAVVRLLSPGTTADGEDWKTAVADLSGDVGTSGVPTGVVAADGSPVMLACPYGTPPDTGPSAQDAQEVAAGYADWVLPAFWA